ncbi:MAG: hypothetical protein OXI46_03910 [Gemmatimonadota bacterium]|nr:hypothetical protein [Gemmatimonadota bacterium]
MPSRLLLALLLLIALPVKGQGFDRFRLFNECAPVDLRGDLYMVGDEVEERIQAMAETRLRAARLYGPLDLLSPADRRPTQDLRLSSALRSWTPDLDVFAAPEGPDSSVETATDLREWIFVLEFRKWVRHPDFPGGAGFFGTWAALRYGAIGSAEQAASELMDTFILEYLRVNGESCD